MKFHVLFILATCLLIAADDPKGEAVKKELEKLQGTWLPIGSTNNGETIPEERLNRIRSKLIISGDKITTQHDFGLQIRTFVVDPTKTPREIKQKLLVGTKKDIPVEIHGIYSHENDTLKILWAHKDGEILTKFESKVGDGRSLTVFRREAKEP